MSGKHGGTYLRLLEERASARVAEAAPHIRVAPLGAGRTGGSVAHIILSVAWLSGSAV